MEMTDLQKPLLEPKKVEIEDQVANIKNTYVISKIPAFAAMGLMVQDLPALVLNINSGNREKIEKFTLEVLSYVAIEKDGQTIRLTTKALIDNHCPSFETISLLLAQMIDYNTSFFRDGRSLSFLKRLEALATAKVTEILTTLSAKWLQKK
jgi:hypothetical protein